MAHPIASVLVLGLALAGCRAQRELVIISDPPGAEIRLDGTLLASKTPARVPFTAYGVRRVTLYMEGYLSYSEAIDVRPPWYGYFPLDLFSEILFPVGWRDRHKLKVQLEPGASRIEAPDLIGVLQRAEQLRRAGPDGPRRVPIAPRRLPTNDEPAEELPATEEAPKTGGGG